MAVFFRGLSPRETFALTDAMIRSGETIDLSGALGRKVVDKHSTGGVGDKTSLAVGADRRRVRRPAREDERPRPRPHRRHARQARVDPRLPHRADARRVRRAGARASALAIVGQTGDLVPADKLLYGLRDVTATVDQLSLIAASIMSKKLAAGAQAIVLDVKVGNGAFMKTLDDARRLAETMLSLGRAGRPRGRLPAHRHGPAARRSRRQRLEVLEALETVRGDGPADFTELVLDACGEAARALRPRDRRGRGPPPRGGRRSRTAPPRRPGAAGSRRRAAPPTRPRCRVRRSSAR